MSYSTEQLIQILDRELQANWKGERILLSLKDRVDDPILAQAMDVKKMSKVFAYPDFRRQIHQYQKERRVSGIVWRNSTFQGKSIVTPEIHNQLIAIDGDKEILIAAKDSILNFWREVTGNLKIWLSDRFSCRPEDRLQKIDRDLVERLVKEAEWAEIDAAIDALYLGLCWGNPLEYQYRWAAPQSGYYRIIAARAEPSSIAV